jgi:hypothetical protein
LCLIKNNYGDRTQVLFLVYGVNNIDIGEYSYTKSMSIDIDYNSGRQEKLFLSLENLPKGINAKIINEKGFPPFSSSIYFYDTSAVHATPGLYEASLVVCNASKTTIKKYPFTIRVKKVSDCRNDVVGDCFAINYCLSGSLTYITTVKKSNINDRIIINNFENNNDSIEVKLYCGFNNINIPNQKVGDFTISGYGWYYLKTNGYSMKLSYTKIDSSGGTSECEMSINR